MPPDFVVGSMIRHVRSGHEAIIVEAPKGARWIWAMLPDGSYAMITKYNSDNWDLVD